MYAAGRIRPNTCTCIIVYMYYRAITLSAILTVAAIYTSAYVVVDRVNTNGMILMKIADALPYSKSLNLVIATPIKAYVEQQSFIEECIVNLENLRDNSKHKINIDSVIYEFKYLSNIIRDMNHMIRGNSNRKKRSRAMLPGVGEFFESFIGTASEKTIDKIYEILRQEGEKRIQIVGMLESQSNSTIKMIELIQNRYLESDKRIREIVDKLNEIIENDENEADQIMEKMQIDNLIQLLTLIILRYHSFQSKMFNHVIQQKASNYDPEIVPFKLLHEMIRNSNVSKEEYADIMYWKNMSESELYKNIKYIPMKISTMGDCIVTEINIPLLPRDKKELFQAIPAPTKMKNVFMFIKPEAPYFITNDKRDEIGYLSENDFKKCWYNVEGKLICPQNFAIYKKPRQNSNNFCELALLSNHVHDTYKCAVHTIPPRDLFIKMNEENQYYYSLFENDTVRAICNKNSTILELFDSGILTINDGCYIDNGYMQIMGQSIVNVKKDNTYFINKHQPVFKPYKKMIKTLDWKSNELLYFKDFENLKEETRKNIDMIRELKKEIVIPSVEPEKEVSFFDSYVNIACVIFGLITAILAVVTSFLQMKKKTKGINIAFNVDRNTLAEKEDKRSEKEKFEDCPNM